MDREQVKKDLERITQKRGMEPGESMADVLRRLDVVSREPELHDRLRHYLSKRSYTKALDWFDHPEAPHTV